MRGPNARTGQHRNRQLGNQRQVERDAIALLNANALKDIRKATNFRVQLLISERARVAGFAFPNQRRLIASPSGQMTIETAVRNINFSADKPLRMRRFPFQNGVPLPKPVQLAFRQTRPKLFRFGARLRAQAFQFGHRFDMGSLGETAGRMKDAFFVKDGFDVLAN